MPRSSFDQCPPKGNYTWNYTKDAKTALDLNLEEHQIVSGKPANELIACKHQMYSWSSFLSLRN